MAQMVITDLTELKTALKAAMIELNEETARSNQKAATADNLYSINVVRKRLNKAHATVKKLVANGMIKSTRNGQISEAAINEYLQKS